MTIRTITAPLSDMSAALGFSAHFSIATGREHDFLGARGWLSDLIVAARPTGEEAASSKARLEVGEGDASTMSGIAACMAWRRSDDQARRGGFHSGRCAASASHR